MSEEVEALKREMECVVRGLELAHATSTTQLQNKIIRLEQELVKTKIKSANRRTAIKEYNRLSELMRACWHKEIALSQQKQQAYMQQYKQYFRFAKFCYQKFHPECPYPIDSAKYSMSVSEWLRKWESEIDERPEKNV